MIDIENAKERDLKNIRQIGNPTEDNKIYIENAAYARIHEEDTRRNEHLYLWDIQNVIRENMRHLLRLQSL